MNEKRVWTAIANADAYTTECEKEMRLNGFFAASETGFGCGREIDVKEESA